MISANMALRYLFSCSNVTWSMVSKRRSFESQADHFLVANRASQPWASCERGIVIFIILLKGHSRTQILGVGGWL